MKKHTTPTIGQQLRSATIAIFRLRQLQSLKNVLRGFLRVLLPSLLLEAFKHGTSDQEGVTSETAWLDGLRGLAAIAVMNFHFLFAFTDLPDIGYKADAKCGNLLRLPIVRLCFDGFSSVCVFFIVSGYVCSLQALRRMHDRQHEKLLDCLSRSVFRRGLRLYLPSMCMAFATAIGAHLGIFERFQFMLNQKGKFFNGNFSEPPLGRFPTLPGQLAFWCGEMLQLMNLWNTKPQYLAHDPHLWSIAYEYRMSLYIYSTLLCITPCRPHVRLFVLVAVGFLNLYWHRWEGPLFFGGVAIAYITVLRETKGQIQLGSIASGQNSTKNFSYRRLLRVSGYGFALWIMSYPLRNFKHPAPGYHWVNHFIPVSYQRRDKFPKIWATLLLILLLATSKNKNGKNASILHRIFTSRFAQYMGQIMFAFYLVHGTILHSIGYIVPHIIWHYTGNNTSVTYGAGLSIGLVVNFGLCLWAADLFTREVGTRCARLTQRLEDICFGK